MQKLDTHDKNDAESLQRLHVRRSLDVCGDLKQNRRDEQLNSHIPQRKCVRDSSKRLLRGPMIEKLCAEELPFGRGQLTHEKRRQPAWRYRKRGCLSRNGHTMRVFVGYLIQPADLP